MSFSVSLRLYNFTETKSLPNMSGIHDTATVTLNVNGAQAKQMMSDLESKIKQTEATIASMKANMADPNDIEKARKQLRTYQKQLEEMITIAFGENRQGTITFG